MGETVGGWGGGERCGCGGREGAERAVEAAGAEGRRFEGEHIGSASFGRKCKSRAGASLLVLCRNAIETAMIRNMPLAR